MILFSLSLYFECLTLNNDIYYTILYKVWLAQKNIRFGINDLDGHDCQIIVAYLYQSRRIGQQTTALGAFQIVLGFLSDTNFTSNELHFIHDKNNEKNEKNSNNNIWPATLYHPVGKDVDDVQFNSLWRISHSALQDIQVGLINFSFLFRAIFYFLYFNLFFNFLYF